MSAEPSGRFVLRVSPDLHAALRRRAARAGLSLNEYCRRTLEGSLKGAGAAVPGGDPARRRWISACRRLLGDRLLGVVLFGSTATGRRSPGSDIDLLIVVDSSLPLGRRLYEQWDRRTDEPALSPHFVHLPESLDQAGSLWFEAAIDGISLFDRGQAVALLLGRLRHEMASGLLVRKTAYGHPYWVRLGQETADAERQPGG